jgi:hypothetical protein
VVVYYDVEFAYAAPLLEAELRSAGYPAAEVAVSRVDRFYVPARGLRLPPPTTATGGGCGSCDCRQPREQPEELPPSATSAVAEAEAAEVVVYGRRIAAPGQGQGGGGQDKKRDVVLFVGEEGPTLTNFVITYSQAQVSCACRVSCVVRVSCVCRVCPACRVWLMWCGLQVWRYSPESRELRRETLSVNKTLMRRYFLVEKTKDADIIGIVAGTLGVCTSSACTTRHTRHTRHDTT